MRLGRALTPGDTVGKRNIEKASQAGQVFKNFLTQLM